MFIIHTVHDTILVPPSNLSMSTAQAIQHEIDQRYPNRVLMDVGLVVARYGDSLEWVSNGVCVAGQAGSHHYCSFELIVFRPFVEEVCIGRIHKSTAEGIYVTTGFFDDIFIPAYWMLRPSVYEESSGLWIWTPDYDDDEDDDNAIEATAKTGESNGQQQCSDAKEGSDPTTDKDEKGDRYDMEIGSEIRFKVKSIHFARFWGSAKGRQAVVSMTDKPLFQGNRNNGNSKPSDNTTVGGASNEDSSIPPLQRPVRKRSSSVGLDEDTELPPTMHIVASICEDGLGLTSWWEGGEEEEEGEEDEGEEEHVQEAEEEGAEKGDPDQTEETMNGR